MADEPDQGQGGPRNNLDRKVGPLTLRAWAVVAPVGIVLGLAARRALARSEPAAAPELADLGADPGAPAYPVGSGGGAGGPGSVSPSSPEPTAAPEPRTNLDWMRDAYAYLVAKGFDPLDSDTALRLYLDQLPMRQQHAALIRSALAGIGPAPEYVGPVIVAPDEAPPAPLTPRADTPPPSPPPGANVTPIAPDPSSVIVVGPGITNEDTRKVQFILKGNGHPEVQVTGNYDGATGVAIRDAQRFFGWPVTGQLTRFQTDAIFGMAVARQQQR